MIKNKKYKINNEIKSKIIKLKGINKKYYGIVSLKDALFLSKKLNLDLIEIISNTKIPLTCIMDHKKLKYKKKKKYRIKIKRKKYSLKEIKFRLFIKKYDFNVKIKNILKILKKKNKIKITLQFKGREIIYKKEGMKKINNLINYLKKYAIIEKMPKIIGNQIITIINPKK